MVMLITVVINAIIAITAFRPGTSPRWQQDREEPCAWAASGHSGPPLDLGRYLSTECLLGGAGC